MTSQAPLIQTEDRTTNQLQQNILQAIKPVLGNPVCFGNLVQNVKLNNGTTVINHGLGKLQQGWFVVDVNGAATIYRNAAFNTSNLTLISSAAVTASIYCF